MKIETTRSIAQGLKLKPVGLAMMCLASSNMVLAAHEAEIDHETATPIKHVIVLIGENRTFDNVFGTYVPRKGQSISNLLSKGIVKADGTPGPKASLAAQSYLNTIPSNFFVSQPASNKAPYKTLPAPNTSYAPAVGATLAQIAKDPGDVMPPLDQSLTIDQLHQVSPALLR